MEPESEQSDQSKAVDTTAVPDHNEPYVGMRPYSESDKEIFYGRDDVALRLRNKIYSNRLTILYASSGVGKTSILQTLVEPELRELDAHVVHFDRWSGDKPLNVLIHAIQDSIRDYDIEIEDNDEISLFKLTQAINQQIHKPLVLILDQFEEFLRKHGQHMDPIRSELAKLVRNNSIQIHIVLSLRQEFLTGLEPFREIILNLFQSTYQLKDLNEKEIRDAITLPVKSFGFTYEDALIDQLIEDLGVRKLSSNLHDREGNIDLPPLQQVLLELWRYASSKRKSIITLALYNQLGGAQKILDDYINNIMPTQWLNKLFVAKLMRALAPPSGLKQSFTPEDLCFAIGMSEKYSARVERELEYLTNQKILRTRKFTTSDEISYELQHDAFVEIISRWRNLVFARLRRIKGYVRAVVVLAVVMLIPTIMFIVDKRDMYMNTEGLLVKFKTDSERKHGGGLQSRLEHATEYILSRKDGEQYFDKLKNLLVEYKDYKTASYGLNYEGLNSNIPLAKNWPVSILYSNSRELKKTVFNYKWKETANHYAETWGIPLPTRLHLQAKSYFDPERIKFSIKQTDKKTRARYRNRNRYKGLLAYSRFQRKEVNEKSINLVIPNNEKYLMVSEKDLPLKTKRFLNYFKHDKNEWRQLQKAPPLGPWWIVPRWSMPAWKVSGKKVVDGSAFLASILALEIKKRPELLLHSEAIDLLLQRVSRRHRYTVREAVKARGEKLYKDLIEVVRNESSLLHLPLILDALAHYPELKSEDAVKQVLLDIKGPIINNKLELKGPWKKGKSARLRIVEKDSPYRDLEVLLPAYESNIKIYYGKKLAEQLDSDGRKSSGLREKQVKLEDDIIKDFGLKLPKLSYKVIKDEEVIDDYSFRLEVLSNAGNYAELKTHKTTASAANQDVMKALKKRVYDYRVFLLTADTTNKLLKELPPKLRKWLKKHYSLTDLKLIFRAIINPTMNELIKTEKDEKNKYSIPAENTLHHLEWLLKTVPFWTQVDGTYNLDKLAENLRQMQTLRLEGQQVGQAKIVAKISEGVEQLQRNNYNEATSIFSEAIQNNKPKAINDFSLKYADNFEEKLEKRLLVSCKSPVKPKLSRKDRVILKNYVSKKLGFPSDKKRLMTLCLLATYPSVYNLEKIKLITKLSDNYPDPDEWPAVQAAWFSRELFSNYDPVTDSDNERLFVQKFFNSSYLRQEKKKDAYKQFDKLLNDCDKSGTSNWCKSWLNKIASKSDDYRVKLSLGYELSKSEKVQDLEASLRLSKNSRGLIDNANSMSQKNKIFYLDYLKYIRANALYLLAFHKNKINLSESERLLRPLLKSSVFGSYAYDLLIKIELYNEEYSEASKLITLALAKWPRRIRFHQLLLRLHLRQDNIEQARKISVEILDKLGISPDSLFLATLGQMFTGVDNWQQIGHQYTLTNHRHRDYIFMLMYANSSGEEKVKAKERLNKRWRDIYTDNWRDKLPDRFKEGDNKAWLEMLIGYYQGVVTEDEIFKPLESDELFNKSYFKYSSVSRKGMLTDAYYYDAMLRKANGDAKTRDYIEGMKKRLQQTRKLNFALYDEYFFAKRLLKSLEKQQGK